MKNLTEGNIYKNFIKFAVPLVLAGVLSQLYHVIDTVIAGRFLGEAGLAAIGATAEVITFASAPFWGFASGFAVCIANLFGARDYRRIKSIIFSNFIIMILAAFALAGVLILCKEPLFDLLNVDPAIRKDATVYFVVCIIGNFLVFMNNTFLNTLGALGTTGFVFFMSILSAVLNISGNLLTVVVLDLGVLGLALSTVLSALVVDIFYFVKLYACFRELGVAREAVSFDRAGVRASLRYGIPCAMQQTVMYVAGAVMTPVVNGIGPAASAGYNVTQRIYNIGASIYQNSAKTFLNYSAQCVGAGRFDRIGRGWRAALIQGCALTVPIVLICAIFADPICRLFFPSGFEGDALGYAVLFSRVYLPFVLFNLINNLFHAFFRGIGSVGIMFSTTLFASVVRCGTGMLLAIPFGMRGVFLGMVIAWVAEALFCLTVYLVRYNTVEKIRTFVLRHGFGISN